MNNDPFAFLWIDDPMVAKLETTANNQTKPLFAATPSDYGLKHSEWRTGQREMIDFAYSLVDSGKTGIVEAATGTGKTALPRALSAKHKTIALVRTRALQADNYEQGYEFEPLYGRVNYQCVHEDAPSHHTAYDCMFTEKGMRNCDFYNQCPYVIAKGLAANSQKAVLNYSYWLNVHHRWNKPQVIVCDEAHQLSDLTLDWAGCTINEKVRKQWDLAPFPMIRGSAASILLNIAPATNQAVSWLEQSLIKLIEAARDLAEWAQTNDLARKKMRQAELVGQKVRATIEALKSVPDDWYIKSGPNSHNGQPAFVARPLTAKHHFARYFTRDDWNLFLMSATIGDPQVFASELGIKNYAHYSVPSLFPKEQRPVLALDTPNMGRGATEKEIDKQADEIAKAIKACPPEWSGIIHVVKISEAPLLADRLAHRGLQDRVWVAPNNLGTDGIVREWRNQMMRAPGSINISWALWEGYDGRNEKISIVAKCPFPYLGDEYERERQRYDGKLYLQRAAWAAEQGCGRSRRGRAEDYDTDAEKRGLVALADGSWNRIKNYFSESFRESIIKN